ncbi:glycosyltransferase family 1 protein [Salibacterium salarium]|uniref:Glycosyltransferase family 1 protein n=1 Tax=Salibacterium salarium TaxID=284579 RepID=A0A428MS79_9BACI|nr:glycosyltransferase [Salibacterium salarium]RSL29030.1 glycosyltransferase family 1 protein [Salibacterium salarium]
MRKLKVLYFHVNQKNYFQEHREYFKRELAKLPEVEVHFTTKGGKITDILNKLDFTPDFIFIENLGKSKPIYGLDKINISKGIWLNDIHSKPIKKRQFIKENKIDIVFGFYRDAFYQGFPDLVDKFIWLPRHANLSVFRDYGFEKTIDYLLMGAISPKVYPVRSKIAQEMPKVKGFIHHKHPGHRFFKGEEKKNALIGRNYAMEINKAKIFFTDDSIYKYPINKYFEIPACNTLLLATGSKELRDLGFKDNETFVEINENNYLEKARYYLTNEKERNRIAKQGYELVRKRHSTEVRAKQFVNHIFNYINQSI